MTEATQKDARKNEALWHRTLVTGHPGKVWGRKLMRLLPGPPRCKVCHNPFGGIGGHICGAIGMSPSRKNPRLCALCCEKMPPGGAEVDIAVLFADVRGSTALAERLGPAAFAQALNEFYATVTKVLARHDATIDKLIGDEVMALYLGPILPERDIPRTMVDHATALLDAIGYGTPAGPFLELGIGLDFGEAFVGNIGDRAVFDFTAVGDVVNTASRLQGQAAGGEIVMSERVAAHLDSGLGEPFEVDLKGKSERRPPPPAGLTGALPRARPGPRRPPPRRREAGDDEHRADGHRHHLLRAELVGSLATEAELVGETPDDSDDDADGGDAPTDETASTSVHESPPRT
jgi:adenylate cyclase